MRYRLLAAFATLLALLPAAPVSAGSVKAIVEEVDAAEAGVHFMEYLAAGRRISLGPSGRVVIGYLTSCLREVVTGGTVVIGEEKSVVAGGEVRRRRVECDGGRLLLTADQAGKSGVLVFRRGAADPAGGAVTPSLRIFGVAPVIRIDARPPSATIERLDRAGNRLVVRLENGMADLAAQKKTLRPGGVYRISGGGKSRVFIVDPTAIEGGPLIGRYIAF